MILNKKKYVVIIITCFMILAALLIIVIKWQIENNENEKVNDYIASIADSTIDATTQETPLQTEEDTPSVSNTLKTTQPPAPEPKIKYKENSRNINFAALQEENNDIIGWIEIPGTVIDYPIVQTFNNDYYMDYNVKKGESIAGAIFMDSDNHSFEDVNIVIYGHNLNNGTMFAALHKYEEESFYEKNKYINIYTPKGQLTYEIFAVYETDDSRILYQADFDNKEYYQSYLDSVLNGDNKYYILEDIKVTTDDNIISLSTCVRNKAKSRFILQGVLLDETQD
jgi:sortase B